MSDARERVRYALNKHGLSLTRGELDSVMRAFDGPKSKAKPAEDKPEAREAAEKPSRSPRRTARASTRRTIPTRRGVDMATLALTIPAGRGGADLRRFAEKIQEASMNVPDQVSTGAALTVTIDNAPARGLRPS
jgi:hypothetical protein